MFFFMGIYAFFMPSMLSEYALSFIDGIKLKTQLQLVVLSTVSLCLHNACSLIKPTIRQNLRLLVLNMGLFCIAMVFLLVLPSSMSYPVILIYNFSIPMYVSIVFTVKLLKELKDFYFLGILGVTAILIINLTTCNLINLLDFAEVAVSYHQCNYDVMNLIICGVAFYLLFITFKKFDKDLQKSMLKDKLLQN